MNGTRGFFLGFFLFFSLSLGLANFVNAEEVDAVTDSGTTTAPADEPIPAAEPAPEVKAPAAASPLMGKDTCLQCHPERMKNTVHSRLHPKSPNLGKLECETCHGSGEAHVAAGGGKGSINAKPEPKVIKDA